MGDIADEHLLGLECFFQSVKQPVERNAEFSYFIMTVFYRESLTDVLGSDLFCFFR